MQRTARKIQIENIAEFKTKLLQWAQQSDTVVWLDSNNYHQKHSSFDAVLAVGTESKIKSDSTNSFDQLKKYQTAIQDYIFGYKIGQGNCYQ